MVQMALMAKMVSMVKTVLMVKMALMARMVRMVNLHMSLLLKMDIPERLQNGSHLSWVK